MFSRVLDGLNAIAPTMLMSVPYEDILRETVAPAARPRRAG